jgi:hypothetical protein
MKNSPDVPQRYIPRIAASPILSSFNQTRFGSDSSIEEFQVDRRWRLFPVQPCSRLTSAKTLIQDATADPAKLEKWASEFPGCNWCLATGAASGVFVLEVDTRIAESTLRVLCEDDYSWNQTLLISAGETGYAFFGWPAGRAMRCSGNLAPGLRIHGEGNSVLVPPSASRAYLYPEATIATAPQWLIDCAFAGVEEQSSGKVLVFPQMTLPGVSTTARPPESSAKLLPFIPQACPSDPRHRVYVYMSFQLNRGRWQLQFFEKDMQTTLARSGSLSTAEAVIALADRGGGLSNLEYRKALGLAIANRRGGIFLSLTTDQYRQLQMATPAIPPVEP